MKQSNKRNVAEVAVESVVASARGGTVIALALCGLLAACATVTESAAPAPSGSVVVEEELIAPSESSVGGAEESAVHFYSDRIADGAAGASGSPIATDDDYVSGDSDSGFSDDIELGGIESSIQLSQSQLVAADDNVDIDRMLTLVWANHPQISRAMSELQATGYDISGAKTGYYPYLSVSAIGADNSDSQTTVNLVQPLWAGGRTAAQVSEAEAEQKRALANLNQTRLNLALETVDAYLSVMLAREQHLLWSRYISSMEVLLGIIERRAKSGVSPPVDIQTALTRFSQAKAGLAANKAILIRSRLRLETLIHQSVPALGWPGQQYRLSQEEIIRILNEGAIGSHPSGQLALAEIEVQRARVRVAKASLFPQLSLQYSHDLDQADGDFTPDSSARLVLEYGTDAGLRGYNGLRAVQQRLQAAQQDLSFSRRDVKDQVSAAYAEREVAQQQFESQIEAATASVKLVGSFLRQFKVGRKAWVEVLNAHREANEALLQISAIKRNYWSANMRLALQGMIWHRVSEDVPATYIEFESEG